MKARIKRSWVRDESSPIAWEAGRDTNVVHSTGGFFFMECRIESVIPLQITVFLSGRHGEFNFGTFDSIEAAIAEAERIVTEVK